REPFLIDPRIVLGPVRKPLLVNRRREELRERRANGFLPRRPTSEIHVSVHREADGRNHIAQTLRVLARQSDGFREAQPRVDAPGMLAVAVVIENAFDPQPTHLPIGAIRENRRVLHRYAALVVVAVSDPAANLLGSRAAAVQHHVEGVVYVIRAALLAQAHLEFLATPRLLAHRTISIPS